MSPLSHAYVLAAIATLCWGVVVVPVKLARISGRLGIGISMLTGALAMAALAGPEMLAALQFSWREMLLFLATGSLQFTLGCMFYYESIRRGSVSIAVPITRIKVILILFFAIGIGLEVFRWSLLGACVLVAGGGILIGRRPANAERQLPGQNHRLSILLAILTCVCWSVGETLIGTLPKDIGPIATNGLLLWSGLLVYAVYAVVSGAWREFRRVPARDALCYVIHGIVSFSVAYVLFVRAIQIAGPPRISCISSTYPLISAAIGWIAFKEGFSWGIGVGAVLLAGGVILLQFA